MMVVRNIAVFLRHDEVSAWQFSDRQAELLRLRLPGAAVTLCRDETEFISALQHADCAVVWRFKQEWFVHAPGLRVLATPAAGKDYFSIIPPDGLHMIYGSFHGELIGETVVGFLLGMSRGILASVTEHAGEDWPRRKLADIMVPLRGSNVTILGFGSIGRWIARLLEPFGVNITGVGRRDGDGCIGIAGLDRILPGTDHLVAALPGTPETRHLINRERIALLPRHATVTNIGRGSVIDSEALADALEEERLAGACLDVFEEEPLPPESRLRCCPHLWRMPHASAIAPNYLDLFIEDFAMQLSRI